jgi:hypothetical protein
MQHGVEREELARRNAWHHYGSMKSGPAMGRDLLFFRRQRRVMFS